MATMDGLLDGATADALKGIFGIDAEADNEATVENSWGDYDDYEPGYYCDNCGVELTVDETPEEDTNNEVLCDTCDRRSSTHAVGRFFSTEYFDED